MMQLAFYRAKTGTIYDKLIDLCSGRLNFSHVEIVFSDGLFFSSSPRDGGCRFKAIIPDDHWELVPIDVSATEEREIRDWCRLLDYARNSFGFYKYDWCGVFRFVLPIPLKLSRHRKFCSEVCAQAVQRVGMWKHVPAIRVSPNELWLVAEAARPIDSSAVPLCA